MDRIPHPTLSQGEREQPCLQHSLPQRHGNTPICCLDTRIWVQPSRGSTPGGLREDSGRCEPESQQPHTRALALSPLAGETSPPPVITLPVTP